MMLFTSTDRWDFCVGKGTLLLKLHYSTTQFVGSLANSFAIMANNKGFSTPLMGLKGSNYPGNIIHVATEFGLKWICKNTFQCTEG